MIIMIRIRIIQFNFGITLKLKIMIFMIKFNFGINLKWKEIMITITTDFDRKFIVIFYLLLGYAMECRGSYMGYYATKHPRGYSARLYNILGFRSHF